MTVLEGIQRSTEFLAKKEVESPRLHAELLLAHVLKLPRMRLYLDFERTLEAVGDVASGENVAVSYRSLGRVSFLLMEEKVNVPGAR